ncbi:MAG: DMT family transporter [Chloroflexi bacterium]|nr:DMT family transporter [Chloroflexota bacterium]
MGALAAIISAVAYGVNDLFARAGLQHLKPARGSRVSLLASLLLTTLATLFLELDRFLAASLLVVFWAGIMGILHYPLGRTFNYLGVRDIGVVRASIIRSANPVVSMVMAVTILKEPLTWPILLGTLSVATGIALLVSGE